MDPSPTVAIVGKPNVGKSTLFNSIIGKRHAVIAEEAGTTRDRVSQKTEMNGYEVILVDTGGIFYGKKKDIESDIQAQAKTAINEADIILFVVDISKNLTVDDFTAANILRKSKKNIILVGNKSDNPEIEKNIFNIYELGFEKPIPVSAIHKTGIDKVKKEIIKKFDELKINKRKKEIPENLINICILGKPNAGKSSLVNAFIGSEKVIVSETPGTTRDVTDTEISYDNEKFNLIDTAGLRKRGKRSRGIEKFSTLRALNSLERSDIVVLLIDAGEGITKQDTHIAQQVLETEKGLIIVVNKIDLFKEKEKMRNNIISSLMRKFSFLSWAPVVFVSAKNKKNIFQIFKIAEKIINERKKRIQTSELNDFLQKITQKHLPASSKIKKPKFMYGSQVDTDPPKFLLFFKNAKNLHFTYPRFIENEIRKKYGFEGTAISIKIKEKAGKISHQ
ncbi:ribosome biogenesis GTPase Der [Candidatus Peregrinibacteria bacterium]|nr:ribosome biogenesis GTPase Der [Candidatus Peregrinibacteria bacterium]